MTVRCGNGRYKQIGNGCHQHLVLYYLLVAESDNWEISIALKAIIMISSLLYYTYYHHNNTL